MSEKQIVLRHVYREHGSAESLRVQPRERLEFLISHAQPGDTLHRVPFDICQDPPALFAEVRRQVAAGEFVPV